MSFPGQATHPPTYSTSDPASVSAGTEVQAKPWPRQKQGMDTRQLHSQQNVYNDKLQTYVTCHNNISL